MSMSKQKVRLENVFEDAWRGKENDDCIWWQGEWWSWNRLNELVTDCTSKLKAAGFTKGQRVAILLPNSPMVIALSVACWRLGGAIAPLNARTGAANLLSTIKMLDVHTLVLSEDGYDKVKDKGIAIGAPITVAKLDAPLSEWHGRDGIPDTEDMAIIFSTSGTSGLPKAVGCLHSNLLDNIKLLPVQIPHLLEPESVFLNVLPNFHTFGFNVAQMLPLLTGVRQTMVPSFVPVANTIRAIIDSGTNTIIAVPTIMAFLIGALDKSNTHLPNIRFVVTGGDRLNTKMDARCKEFLGVGILEGYGLTECSPVVAVCRTEETKKLGTVGPFLKSYEYEVRDREGNKLDIHEEGVLWVKGPSVVPGYFRDEINTRERFCDGWFNTGDVVRIDENGFVKIIDRATDIIIVSGFNVYPQEVEAVLCQHPAVHSAVAVGEKNNVAGELVKAFIILNDGAEATEKELMNYCKERLAHYKVPRKIGFVTEYPISPSGKILRRELRKMKIEHKSNK